MKKVITLLLFVYSVCPLLFAQQNIITKNNANGNWIASSAWQTVWTPSYTVGPGLFNNNALNFRVSGSLTADEVITFDQHTITITVEKNGILSFEKGFLTKPGTFNIVVEDGGKLLVEQDLVIDNDWNNVNVTVKKGGTMSVAGDLSVDYNATFTIEKDAIFEVGGAFSAKDQFTLNLEDGNFSVVGDFKSGNNTNLNIKQGGDFKVEGGFESENETNVNVANDALFFVRKDLTFGTGPAINTSNGGYFVVGGDLLFENEWVDIDNKGAIVVVETIQADFNMDEHRDFGTTQADTYVFDGVFDPTGLKANFNEGDEDDLKNNDLDLYNLVMELMGMTPQPVTLLYFKVLAQHQYVEVNWATAKAWDFSHYELERSADGKTFEYVSTIDAEEETNSVVEYSYPDRQPISGVSYYRLKAVDIDGAFEYKEVAVVKFGAESLRVFPNPSTSGFIHVSWSHAMEGAMLSLRDQAGRTVLNTKMSGNTISVSTKGLASGIYLLSIQSPVGIQQSRVLVN